MKLRANPQSSTTNDFLLLIALNISSPSFTFHQFSSNEEPSLHIDNNSVTGYHAILNGITSPLIAGDEQQQKRWIDFRLSKLADLSVESDSAKELNEYLSERVFLDGYHVTVADFVVFSGIHSFIEGLSDKQRLAVPHIVRWFDNIQNLPEMSSISVFEKVAINQNLTPQNAQEKKEKKAPAGESLKAQEKKKEEPKQAAVAAVKVEKPTVEAVPPQPQAPAQAAAPTSQDNQESDKKEQPKREKKEQPKREKKEAAPKPAAKGKAAPAEAEQPDVAHLDIRVGLILEAVKHPEADNLYVEQIDLGEGQPRTIVSGLVQFVPVEEMQKRKVIVLCNLKPKKTRGVESNGMVLCSKNVNADGKEVVEPLDPPAESQPGDRVYFPGLEGQPDAVLNPKKKYWEKTQPDFKTNDQRVALYKDVPFTTSKGVVTSKTVTGGSIS